MAALATTTPAAPVAASAQIVPYVNQLRSIMRSEDTVQRFMELMNRQQALIYIGSVIVEVSNREDLWDCSYPSIINSALKAATLQLSVDSSLGQAYLAPFNCKIKAKKDQDGRITVPEHYEKRCTLIPGYRGYEQLAYRTRKYRTLNVFPVYEGQEYQEDQLSGKGNIVGLRKPGGQVIGYGLYLEWLNGQYKTFYMTSQQILEHAQTYSKGWNSDFWQNPKKRVEMMRKTPLRLGLLKYGEMSPFDASAVRSAEEENGEEPEIVNSSFLVSSEPIEDGRTGQEKQDQIMDELGFGDAGRPTAPKQASPDPASEPVKVSPPAVSPQPAAPADTVISGAPAGKMTYETACNVISRSTNERYGDIPTSSLAGRLQTKMKIRQADRDEQTQFEIDAIQCILSYRYNHPELKEPSNGH